MDIIDQLENIGNIQPVRLTSQLSPDEIAHDSIIRIHVLVMLAGLIFTLFMILL